MRLRVGILFSELACLDVKTGLVLFSRPPARTMYSAVAVRAEHVSYANLGP